MTLSYELTPRERRRILRRARFLFRTLCGISEK